ncbi:MAG: hypothetical protein R2845_00275 [Thermomicrobiales bacterium]
MGATVTEVELKRGVTGLVIENKHLAVTVLPDRGADIISIVHKAGRFDPSSGNRHGAFAGRG